ncbi:hypothetical protein FRB90_000799 [Tulasnella sp. 427]|nr:hypothetical protein FRB90_000799 [Tulasnella sp. 427]
MRDTTPKRLTNIDGSENKTANVTEETVAKLHIGSHTSEETFLKAEIGKYGIVLGRTFVQKHQPTVEWSEEEPDRIVFTSRQCSKNCLPQPIDAYGEIEPQPSESIHMQFTDAIPKELHQENTEKWVKDLIIAATTSHSARIANQENPRTERYHRTDPTTVPSTLKKAKAPVMTTLTQGLRRAVRNSDGDLPLTSPRPLTTEYFASVEDFWLDFINLQRRYWFIVQYLLVVWYFSQFYLRTIARIVHDYLQLPQRRPRPRSHNTTTLSIPLSLPRSGRRNPPLQFNPSVPVGTIPPSFSQTDQTLQTPNEKRSPTPPGPKFNLDRFRLPDVPEEVSDQEILDFVNKAVDITYRITLHNPNVTRPHANQTCKKTGNQQPSRKPAYQRPQPSVKRHNPGKSNYVSKPPRINREPLPNIWLWNHRAYHPTTSSYNYWGNWNPQWKFDRKTGIKFDEAIRSAAEGNYQGKRSLRQ